MRVVNKLAPWATAVTLALASFGFSTASIAQDSAQTLDELLEYVKQGKAKDDASNRKREARFAADKASQQSELNSARKTKTQEEKRSAELEKIFQDNKEKITVKREELKNAKGELTELFGHINSTAGDVRDSFNMSLASVQYPGRDVFLTELIEKLKGDALPTIEEIERVWFEIQREVIESGKVVSFNTTIATAGGEETQADVVRVGLFNIVTTDGDYLRYSDGALSILARQPKSTYTSAAATLASSSAGASMFGADPTGPTGGSLLRAFINSPTIVERWHQGGVVGYVISAVGVIAMLIALWRFIALTLTGISVNGQLKSSEPSTNNPLGRVLAVGAENPNMDGETLELKLNEAVLKEIPKLENSLTLIKIIAAVAPLLGLLGTVTGMIITFQSITIFGAGDPKTMAGGISSALITTVLGLVVAIPTLLAHTVVNGRAKRIIHILEEQAAGIIARNAEK